MSCDHLEPALEASRWSRVTKNALCAVSLRVVFHTPPIAMNSGGQAMELDAMAILAQPALALLVEPVTGRVVDEEEHLAALATTHELPQELEEGGAVEHRREPERELGRVECDRAEHMRGPAQPVGLDTRLSADPHPRAMQTAALPEAGLVLEHDHASAASCLPADRGQALGEPELLRFLRRATSSLPGDPERREALTAIWRSRRDQRVPARHLGARRPRGGCRELAEADDGVAPERGAPGSEAAP